MPPEAEIRPLWSEYAARGSLVPAIIKKRDSRPWRELKTVLNELTAGQTGVLIVHGLVRDTLMTSTSVLDPLSRQTPIVCYADWARTRRESIIILGHHRFKLGPWA